MSEETADILMRQLPPTGWGDLATKADLVELGDGVRTEMAVEFAKVRAEMATEFANVRAEMATEFANVRAEMNVMKTELKLYFEEAIHAQTKSMFRQVFAANALFITLILAAAQIF